MWLQHCIWETFQSFVHSDWYLIGWIATTFQLTQTQIGKAERTCSVFLSLSTLSKDLKVVKVLSEVVLTSSRVKQGSKKQSHLVSWSAGRCFSLAHHGFFSWVNDFDVIPMPSGRKAGAPGEKNSHTSSRIWTSDWNRPIRVVAWYSIKHRNI